MRKIALDRLDTLFAAVAAAQKLYLPVDTSVGSKYVPWQQGLKMSEALNTVRSPKDFFFPQTEQLMAFKVEGKQIEVIDTRSESEDFVVFGVRACDVKALDVLDRVFLAEPVDTYYQNRRAHATVVSLACNKPLESCFCATFGIDAAAPQGDVACYQTQDTMYLDALTEKGEAFLALIQSVTESADAAEITAQQALIRERLSKLPLASLKADDFGADKTQQYFDAPQWAQLSEACLGCGTCTFVCPTCQCYDIRDFDTGHGVQRMRCWDSCMYSDFTKMAHGNPRLTQKERFRQRFMHKLVYFPTNNNGEFSCVGCGRCVTKCPIHMNIVKVMKTLGGKDNG